MRGLEQFGWFVFNIAIPLLAPLALLPLLRLPTFFREHARGAVLRAMEHGQLLWTAIPMNASAGYVIGQQLNKSSANPALMWVLLCGHVALIVLASVLVLIGTMEASLRSDTCAHGPNRILRVSVTLTAITAAMHLGGYIWLFQPVVH
ncbi:MULTISPECIES: hypothetical protein [unclassified Cupriavidus]|uniref:hypothetical protein n=1 Tax=unclassified Cupriavidus TaxID=2640874 RepID=UPI0010F4D83B|nr:MULTISPECIES: hypothetical protein [unclassified Cupriavidus]MWL88072.1 hypothetical protein [Cupriavidus sp. SW-Y-13]